MNAEVKQPGCSNQSDVFYSFITEELRILKPSIQSFLSLLKGLNNGKVLCRAQS